MGGDTGVSELAEPGTLQDSEHEARRLIIGELHARPILPLSMPRRIYHYAY